MLKDEFEHKTKRIIECYHHSMKSIIKLDNYYLSSDLKQAIADFVCVLHNAQHLIIYPILFDDLHSYGSGVSVTNGVGEGVKVNGMVGAVLWKYQGPPSKQGI